MADLQTAGILQCMEELEHQNFRNDSGYRPAKVTSALIVTSFPRASCTMRSLTSSGAQPGINLKTNGGEWLKFFIPVPTRSPN